MKRLGILIVLLVVMFTACGILSINLGGVSDPNVRVAAQMAGVLYNPEDIQQYYDSSVTMMTLCGKGASTLSWSSDAGEDTALLLRPVAPTDNALVPTDCMMCYPLWHAFPRSS
jgi:hypothetical protein